MKIVYAVHQGDTDVSRGYPKWYFEKRVDAEKCAKGRGWYGGTAPISEIFIIEVNKKVYVLKDAQPIKLNEGPEIIEAKIAAAKAKLTDEELKLLGIKQ